MKRRDTDRTDSKQKIVAILVSTSAAKMALIFTKKTNNEKIAYQPKFCQHVVHSSLCSFHTIKWCQTISFCSLSDFLACMNADKYIIFWRSFFLTFPLNEWTTSTVVATVEHLSTRKDHASYKHSTYLYFCCGNSRVVRGSSNCV